MLSKLRVVVNTVAMYNEYSNSRPSGHEVANLIGTFMSRATAYRWLKKAEKLELVSREKFDGKHEWLVTSRGLEFLGAFNAFPEF